MPAPQERGYGRLRAGYGARVEFRILGPLEVWHDGRPLRIGGAKERAVLVLLLLHANETVSADRLIDEVWSDDLPATAKKSLHVRVAGLRRALGEGKVLTRGGGYAISLSADELDLNRFERLLSEGRDALAAEPAAAARKLREALTLWRGPALADFVYDSFAQAAIARLEELRLTALELQIEAELALGRQEACVGRLQELVKEHPLREKLRGLLMLALYRDGRQADALEVYRRAREQLVDELGVEPGPALQQLQRAILVQQPSLNLTVPEWSILVAAAGALRLDALLSLAEPLAKRPARELIVVQLIPPGENVARAASALAERALGLLGQRVVTRTLVFTTAQPGDDLVRLALEQDVDLLLLDCGPEGEDTPALEIVLARAPCDVAIHVGRTDPQRHGPVLVLFGGGDHDWTAVEVGAWIARAQGTVLRLAGPAEGAARDASRALASASLAVQRVLGIAAEPLLLPPAHEDVLAAAAEAAVVVVGLPERWKREGIGPLRTAIARRARPPALLVRRGLRPSGLAPRESLTRFTWTLGPAPR
jgi:DNA-binding SARP family transcriptional activator